MKPRLYTLNRFRNARISNKNIFKLNVFCFLSFSTNEFIGHRLTLDVYTVIFTALTIGLTGLVTYQNCTRGARMKAWSGTI